MGMAAAAAGCDSILGIEDHPLVTAIVEARSDASSDGSAVEGSAHDAALDGNPGAEAADATDGSAPADAVAGGSAGVDAALDGRVTADAAADANASPDAAAAVGCTEGDTQCSSVNPNVPQTCNSSGQWVDGHACPYACAGGLCVGVCTPGMTRCSGATPETCGDTAQWVDGAVTAGACGAVCTPNETQCQVNDLATCQSDGTWQPTSCPNGCLNNACRDGTYGTIGVAGTVTCETSPGLLTCMTNVVSTTACCWNYATSTGTCYATSCPGYNGSTTLNFSVVCDGPNDCTAGQVCCFVYAMGGAATSCEATCTQPAPPAPVTEQTVCDPGAPTCATGTCQAITVYGHPAGTPLYTCQ